MELLCGDPVLACLRTQDRFVEFSSRLATRQRRLEALQVGNAVTVRLELSRF